MMKRQFSKRNDLAEDMDDLLVSGLLIDQTLKELDIINYWLGGNRVTIKGIRMLVGDQKQARYHIADLGCGSGGMLKQVADWGRKQGIELKLTGIDANPYIIEYARRNSLDYPEIGYEVANILDPSFQQQEFDIIISTLFTHHFSNDQLKKLLENWCKQTRCGVVINDLHRHWLAYYAIRLLTGIMSKSSMVKNDAPVSVLRGFNRKDLELLLSYTTVRKYYLTWKWAFRWLLVMHTGGR